MAGVGRHIRRRLSRLGYSVDPVGGCHCWQLAQEMDRLGPDGCEAELDRLTVEMLDSIKRWRAHRGGVLGAVTRPPPCVVRSFITWAIQQSRRDDAKRKTDVA